ncbi:MAG: pyrimidine 5'-nucleotidase [Chloroflexota bacterium]
MRFSTLLFDLDDTLYPSNSGLWQAIRSRIDNYMHNRLGIPWEEIPELRKQYYEGYGTTLRGLQANYGVDGNDYLSFVHDVPLEDYIKPDPKLGALLESLPQSKWIFTNADGRYAERVLDILDVRDYFAGVVDVRAINFTAKPMTEAYNRALELIRESNPGRCVLLDDSPRNLAWARSLGYFTVLVGSVDPHPEVHRNVPQLYDLPEYVPELWE